MNVSQQSALDELLDFLASGPTLQEIVDFRASPGAQDRLRALLDANRAGTLSDDERAELDDFERIDYVVSLLKVRARLRLTETP